jgi:hypothetical protein
MKPPRAALFALFLSACVASQGASVQRVDGVALQVATDDGYYWPAPVPDPASGTEIEVFPLVTALVVTRRDGLPMDRSAEAVARQAANAHCAGLGLGGPGASARYANGAWAFFPCAGG